MVRVLCATCALILISYGPLSQEAEGKPPHRRTPWTTSRLIGSPDPPAPYRLQRAFPALQFTNPVVLTSAPGEERLFLVEVKGRVLSFPGKGNPQQADLAIDLSKTIADFNQVYGLTFHPQFAENRYCYICYVLSANLPQGTRVSRFRVLPTNPPRIDPASEQVLITWLSGGHNGGCLKFGPDGMLYITTGDGGPAFPPDPRKSGQDVTNLRSAVLRIDVDHPERGRAYRIPADNPFVKMPGARGEIWAYGFRNPWKLSVDPDTGDLWVGDVGWEMWEMIYRVEKSGNYGWSLVEASQPVHRERQRGPTPIRPPTAAHSHTESRSITGGHVYRGRRLKELFGAYVYGDYVTGKIWALRQNAKKVVTSVTELMDSPIQVICFGVDNEQELYVVGYDGTIHRLVPNQTQTQNKQFPRRLSETGLFQSVAKHELQPGVLPYSIVAEPWQDHATAERFLGLPGNSQLDVWDRSNVQIGFIKGTWKFPENGILGKTISLEMERGNPATRRRLETQIFQYFNGSWRAYSYRWNAEQTDAVLMSGEGASEEFLIRDPSDPQGQVKQTWRYASRSECLLCHTTRAGTVHGFYPEQLNRRQTSADGGGENQLDRFNRLGIFLHPPEAKQKIVSPYESGADLTARARAYLHVNCGHCHRRGGGGSAAMDLPLSKPLEKTNLLGARPTQGGFGLHGAEILAPSDPYRSVLLYRLTKAGRGRMPQFGSSLIDKRGLKLMHDWIAQMPQAEADSDRARRRAAQRAALTAFTSGNDPERALDRLLESSSGTLLLAYALHTREIAPAARSAVIARAGKLTDPTRRDLLEPFLPEAKRTRRLGAVVDAKRLLQRKGNAAAGQKLFESGAGVQCRNCHQVRGRGKSLGPNLDGIGSQLNKAQLLESILEPSKRIDPKFTTYLVETSEGRVLSGLLVSRTDKQVVLKDVQHRLLTIRTEDMEVFAPQQKSLMPELLVRELTAQQVADLLAYLQSLKPPKPSGKQ